MKRLLLLLPLLLSCGTKFAVKTEIPIGDNKIPVAIEVTTAAKAASSFNANDFSSTYDRKYAVYFDFDDFRVRDEYFEPLQIAAKSLKTAPVPVVLEGHCDERGTTEYNLALGKRRAEATKHTLEEFGVNPDQITTVSFGKERPLMNGHDEESYHYNRRCEFTVR